MPKRSSNSHLPPRVYIKFNTYWFVDKNNKWHKLGREFGNAMLKWTEFVGKPERISTMNQLFDRYMHEVAPKKSASTYKANCYGMSSLRIFFGDMVPEDVTAVVIYQFMDVRGEKAPISANREKSLLSHCFSMAIRWGIVKDNPCRHVKRNTERPRERYIEDWEFLAVRNIAPDLIKYAMDLAYITGQRIGDLLRIQFSDLTEDGIKIKQGKTGSKILIEWTDALRSVIQNIKKMARPIRGLHLFCTRRGKPYGVSGFHSIWQRVMNEAMGSKIKRVVGGTRLDYEKVSVECVIKERFTFHDIRAKSHSDGAKSELLGHADPRITERVYSRKYKRVSPLR